MLLFEQLVIRDTDNLILAISVPYELKWHTTVHIASAKKRKNVWLGTIKLTEKYYLKLVGIYVWSGNNYVSSFFKRGKEKCWKIIEKFPKFLACFKTLATAKNDMEISLTSWKNLFALCMVQNLKENTK